MESEQGKMYIGTAFDNSELYKGADEAKQIVRSVEDEAEQQSERVRELMTNIPTVNLDVVTNASSSLETIDQAFAEIDRVVDTNKAAIRDLEKEYQRLASEQGKAFQKGDDKAAKQYGDQARAIREVIKVRKQVNAEAAATADQLAKEEQEMKKAEEEAKKTANAHVSVRQRLRELKMELMEMEATGQRGTQTYRDLQEEAARLTDAWGDAQAQATILANDQRGMQGLISGLTGISGAATAAQGAISLFAGENEQMQKIMLKVQFLMAITIGLQQVQQTLNKDSAFSLVTLNGLKEWWNKLLVVGAGAQAAETAAETADTAADVANSAATAANTAAKQANAVATGASTAATGANTVGQAANTAAAAAGTVANIGLAGAFRMVGAAIKSIPVFGWIAAAIGAIIAVVSHFIDKANEADKELEEHEKLLESGREAYAKASLEIENYKARIDSFNGTKKQESELVKELNSKYGEAIGYYDSLEQWKRALIERGEAYCEVLLKEAEALAILSKYTEAYINLQEVKDKVAAGEYHHWYNTAADDAEADAKAIKGASDAADKWMQQYKEKMKEAADLRQNFDIGNHTDPTTVHSRTGSTTTTTFDPAKAALETQRAIEEYRKSVADYVKDAGDELNGLIIDAQEQGLTRELNEIRRGTRQKLEAWNEQLERLAEARRSAAKTQYMSQEGATEVGWANSDDGKKSVDDWIAVIKAESPEVIAEFDKVWEQITANGEQAVMAAQKSYRDALVEEFGTDEQKSELLNEKWAKKLKFLPPEFLDEATRQMEEEFAKLGSDKFKASINWESVFGDLSKQALPTLEFTLGKVREYFEQNKGTFSTQEIKDYQEAITNMENEIASRNPFTALHKSIADIGAAKTELVAALAEMRTAEDNYNAALAERNAAQTAYNEILERIEDGELEDGSEEQTEASDRLTKAKEELRKATEEQAAAEQRAMTAQNRVTASYKTFTSSLKNVGAVVKKVGGQAKDLAAVFSDDVAAGIGKALDFMDEILGATSDVIDAIGDTGKSVAKGIETTVQDTASGATAAAAAGATAISTIEKASVILAVISAALQVATAIANLFNNDDKKQKEIEKLQERIDQLQWELDNKEAVRLQDTYGSAVEKLKKIYAETTEEIVKMHTTSEEYGNAWYRWLARLQYKSEIYEKSIEKIADAYASVSYTADKALGSKRYDESRQQLENLAEQQILIQKQIDKENSKKKTDKGKIQDWKNQIAEIAEEMATIINDMLEDIIGSSAEDLASELGDAFFETAQSGEDAMEAWHDKVNEIVGDILKRMLITQYLEPEIGKIFDKYKSQWFGTDGRFKGIQAVIDSSDQMAADINAAGDLFNQIYNGLSDKLKEYFAATDEASREASEKGIATASQESVDELNGRATAIQGHTYNISEYTRQLVGTTNLILQSVLNIEGETDGFGQRLERMESDLKGVKDTVDDIALKGIKIQ